MHVRRIWALHGPNIWAPFPMLEVWVDLADEKGSRTDQLPGLIERLMAWLPSLGSHPDALGRGDRFAEELGRGIDLARVLERVLLELQSLSGTPVAFGRSEAISEPGVYRVAVEYAEEDLARACLTAAMDLCLAARDARPFDVAAEVRRLRDLGRAVRLGPDTEAIVAAAKARGIPARRLDLGRLVQLGHGVRQRRISASGTDRTGAIAESIAQDKELTRSLLRAVGVPVPDGRPASDADDAWKAACELGGRSSSGHGTAVLTTVSPRP